MRIKEAKKVKRSQDKYKVVRASNNEKMVANMTDVHDREGAKTRVGKFVHFSGNASPPRGNKVTGNRQDTCDKTAVPVWSRASYRVLSFRFKMPTVRLILFSLPFFSSCCRRFYNTLALLLSQFSAAKSPVKSC